MVNARSQLLHPRIIRRIIEGEKYAIVRNMWSQSCMGAPNLLC